MYKCDGWAFKKGGEEEKLVKGGLVYVEKLVQSTSVTGKTSDVSY